MTDAKTSQPSQGLALWPYLRDIDNAGSPLLALISGYAVALFGWAVVHRAALGEYILENRLPIDQREVLAALLVAGMAVALGLWLALGRLVARRRNLPVDTVLPRLARRGMLLWLLPFLPVLAIPRLAAEPLLLFSLIAAMAAIALAALWPMSRRAGPVEVTSVSPATTAVDNRWGLIAVTGLALGYALFMSAFTVARHNAFQTHAFDLGIYDQGLYTLLRYGYMRPTLFGEEAIIHAGEHFSPIFYLVAPLYALAQNARTLLILQSVFLAAGAIPVYLLARLKLGGQTLPIALSAAYLLYPALHGVNTFDFHQIALVVPLLLFSLYFLEAGRTRLALVFLALSALTKEEVALTVVAVGLYVGFFQRRPKLGALIVVVAGAYFLLVTQVIMPALGGQVKAFRFDDMTAPGADGLAGVALTVFTNPVYTLNFALLAPDKLLFLAQLLLPILFLPLLAPTGWIVALPGLATALLSSYAPQISVDTHYPAIIIPPMFFLAALGLRRAAGANWAVRRSTALAAALLVASLAMSYRYGWVFSQRFEGLPPVDAHDRLLDSFVADIPADASVSTLSDIVPHLSNRAEIYLFPDVRPAEYVLFDTALDTNFYPLVSRDARGEAISVLAGYIASGDYGLVREQDGVLLLRRGQDTANNGRAMQALLSTTYPATALRSAESVQTTPDRDARHGQARVSPAAAGHEQDRIALAFGPYATLLPGKYRIEARLKIDDHRIVEPVATVDAFSFTAGGPLAGLELTGADFAAANQYQTFSYDVEIRDALPDVEFRVLHTGRGTLALDEIKVTFLEPLPSP